MINPKSTYLGRGERFESNGLQADMAIFQLPDGRVHVCLDEAGTADPALAVGKSTRFGYRVDGDEALLLGILVAKKQRGANMAGALVDYAIRHIEDREGLAFDGTGQIHKPVVALVLERAGLVPEPGGAIVDLLPRSELYPGDIPNVHMFQPCDNPENVVLGSDAGPFYHAIPTPEVVRQFPFHEPNHVLAIHTTYRTNV